MTNPSTISPTRNERTTRLAALDGLRGFALLGMMAWHAQVSWVKGGFARMTIFFVLAGFLAARSLARTDGRTMAQRFGSFWTRRARRLLPVTLLSVGVAVAVTRWWGGPGTRDSVLGDAVSVLTSWSNWRFVFEDRSYGAMFESPSAFQHFWSLSLEEQCLFVLPLLLLGIGLVVREPVGSSSNRTIVAVLAAAAACGLLPLVVPMAPDTAYYGTHVRLGEFLVGVAVALWWGRQRPRSWSPRRGVAIGAAGLAGFLLLVVVMLTIDRTAGWVYRGGMVTLSIPVAAAIVAISAGAGPLPRLLALWPLAACGRAAFSIYALHWPVFVVVEANAGGWSRTRIVLVSFAVAFVIGALVHVAFERPLLPGATGPMGRAWARPAVAFPTAGVAAVACVVFALSVPPEAERVDFEIAAEDDAVTMAMGTDEALAILEDPDASRPALPVFRDTVRTGVALYGGSTALSLALGADGWATDTGWVQPLPGYAPLGCGLLHPIDRGGGHNPGNLIPNEPPPVECNDRIVRWKAATVAYEVDVPIIVASSAELTTQLLAEQGPWLALGDPAVDALVRAELIASVEAFRSIGIERVWATNHAGPDRKFDADTAAERRRRIEAYDAILRDLEAEGWLEVIDLLGWSDAMDDDEYARVFYDGVHLSSYGADRAWRELVGPVIPRMR